MVLRNVTLQTIFRIVSAITIPKTICGKEQGYIVIFNRIAKYLDVALLVPPMVRRFYGFGVANFNRKNEL